MIKQTTMKTTLRTFTLLMVALPFSSYALNWAGGAGNWNDPAMWGGSVPTTSDAVNFYSNGTATIDSPSFGRTSDFGRVGNSATMNITSTGSLTLPDGAGFPGTIWQAWVHGSTGADTSIINVNGGLLDVEQIDAGMQNANDVAELNISNGGTADISYAIFYQYNGGLAGQSSVISVTGTDSSLTVGAGGIRMRGGEDKLTLSGASTITAGYVDYDDRDGNAFTVGSGSTLNLGDASNNIFDHGLSVSSGGTLGTAENAAVTASFGSSTALSLASGAILDFSINGNTKLSDEFVMNSGSLSFAPSADIDLVVDLVAGQVLGADPDFTIFSWTSGTGPTSAEFAALNWDISAAPGARVASFGDVIYSGNATTGTISLSGFEAFAIPEPSTAMLMGMGALVMILRRRIRK